MDSQVIFYLLSAIALTSMIALILIALGRQTLASQLQSLQSEHVLLQKELKTAQHDLEKNKEKSDRKAQNNGAIEKQLESFKFKEIELTRSLESERQQLKQMQQRLENQGEHLAAQVHALTQQLSEADRERAHLQRQLNELEKHHGKEAELKLQQSQQHAENQLKNLREKNQQLDQKLRASEKEAQHMQATLAKINPQEYIKYRRKAVHYSQLYLTMKGLKEMAEERNQNWEYALRVLALAVLNEKNIKPASTDIGPIVGEALEAIGESLVIDSEATNQSGHALAEEVSVSHMPPGISAQPLASETHLTEAQLAQAHGATPEVAP